MKISITCCSDNTIMPKPARRTALPRLVLSAKSREPLHLQIYRHLRQAVLTGTLGSGSQLPSTRSLAADLGVSRTTVLAAYDQLLSEGYIEGRIGSGTRIARHLPEFLPTPTPAKRCPPPVPALPSNDGASDHPSIFGPEFRL